MFAIHRCARVLASLAALGMLASPVLGAMPVSEKHATKSTLDVRLTDSGHLVGQAVDSNGRPQAGQPVMLRSKTKELAGTKTDRMGRFVIPVNKSGAYFLTVNERTYPIRAWRKAVAPPKAKLGVLCISSEETVRGQLAAVGASSLVVGGVVAASVIAPLGLSGVIDMGIVDLDEEEEGGSGEPAS